MFRKQDPYTYTQFLTLYNNPGGVPTPIGLLALDYQVALYNDVQVLNQNSVNQPQNQQFILQCTQRIIIQNAKTADVSPIAMAQVANESFIDYPVLLTAGVKIDISSSDGLTLNLLDYSPHTVNTAVQQSTSNGSQTGQTAGASTSSTTGSSYSQSSTYGVSVGVGSGMTASAERTTTSTSEKSNTSESNSSNASGSDSSTSASMSVKDWGAYASVSPNSVSPSWLFGQEYPWNAVQCRYAEQGESSPYEGQVPIYISTPMANNLYSGSSDNNSVFLYPPSELSMYGLNFVMKVSWRIYVDYGASTEITIQNPINYYTASHNLSSTTTNGYVPKVYMDKSPAQLTVNLEAGAGYVTPSTTLDLNIMALDPIGVNSDSAIVGFIPNKFIPLPSSSGSAPKGFTTIATTNDLMIQDTTKYPSGAASGFTVSQTCLTATWNGTEQLSYQLTLFFKVTDSVSDYTLYIKHWITQQTGVALTIVVNSSAPNPVSISKGVDALEAEGGESNILSIALRNLDFASVEYHDYLQLGLNSVTITMEPQAWTNCGYQIRDVSIVKS